MAAPTTSEHRPGRVGWVSLPTELTAEALSFCSSQSLGRVAQVCRCWAAAVPHAVRGQLHSHMWLDDLAEMKRKNLISPDNIGYLNKISKISVPTFEKFRKEELELFADVPRLKEVSICGIMPQNATAVAKAIAQHCPNLINLHLLFQFAGTVIQIAQGCPRLEELDLSYSLKITDATVRKILQHGPSLKTLNLTGCDDITMDEVREIRKGFPHLKIVY